jgi:hypothetical protein
MVGRGEDAEEWETERIKVPSKLDAIKIDNDMAGEGSEAKTADALTALIESIRESR